LKKHRWHGSMEGYRGGGAEFVWLVYLRATGIFHNQRATGVLRLKLCEYYGLENDKKGYYNAFDGKSGVFFCVLPEAHICTQKLMLRNVIIAWKIT